MYWAELKGIAFVEGLPERARIIRLISSVDSAIGAQLRSLDDIKAAMVREVIKAGGNAIVNFKYGQKSSFWRSIFSVDEMYWTASGEIAVVDRSTL